SGELARKVAVAVSRLRGLDLEKRPGIAETIDWARALAVLGANGLDPEAVDDTLGSVVKDHDDLMLVRDRVAEVIGDG
ncbi:MAG TPA: MoxR family ATPase, partial [Actinomycetes bacterium]|nr:MoxR family ATPase [Actinomycetes bacterium]